MGYTVNISPSPVASAFSGIQWDPLDKLKLTESEKSVLRSGEDNPVEYTLGNLDDACLYIRALLKLLSEAAGPRGPSAKVSHLREPLPEPDALQLLYIDPAGVVIHYAISKLYDVILGLLEKKPNSQISIQTAFFENDTLIDEWRSLLRVLHLGGSGDPFAQRGAAVCLTYILMVGCPSQYKPTDFCQIPFSSVKEPLQALISWITSQLQSSSGATVSLVTPSLLGLMNCTEARLLFASSGGIGYVTRHIRSKQKVENIANTRKEPTVSVQRLYELCFCLWALTYECNSSNIVRTAFAYSSDGAIRALTDLVATAPREKVVRIALSSLRNLAELTPDCTPDSQNHKVVDKSVFVSEMICCGLMKHVDLLRGRQWSDPDIVDDLNTLHKLLHENYKDLSRWDLYEAEVESGNLQWGILHTEKFFQQNCQMLEGKNLDFRLVKILIALVANEDEDIAAVACYDLGEFVRFYPNGRAVAKRLGAKETVMRLIDHKNPELQRYALQCISKLMIQNWYLKI